MCNILLTIMIIIIQLVIIIIMAFIKEGTD